MGKNKRRHDLEAAENGADSETLSLHTASKKPGTLTGGQDQTTSVDKESRDIAYTTKTTLSQGFLDLALLTSSARKLRDVMELDQWKLNQHVTFGCLILSIILQIAVGIILLLIGRRDFKRANSDENLPRLQRLNDTAMALAFLIAVVDIFISTFDANDVSNNNIANNALAVMQNITSFQL